MLTSEACNDITAFFGGSRVGGGRCNITEEDKGRGYTAQQSWVLNVLLDSNDIPITELLILSYSNHWMLHQKSLNRIEQLKRESHFAETIQIPDFKGKV